MGCATTQYIRCTLALGGLIALGLWSSRGMAQIAPWQQPPTDHAGAADERVYGPACPERPETAGAAPSPNAWTDESDEQFEKIWGSHPRQFTEAICEATHDRLWFRSEFLGWWTKGFAAPPLLTTSPAGTDVAQAGVLGAAGTSVLLGDTDLHSGFRPGERLAFGAWLGHTQTWGVEATYLQIARQSEYYQVDGSAVPILARPFFNTQTGQQDSQIINYPGQQSGSFASAAASELQAGEILLRKNLTRRGDVAIDLTAGYRYQQLNGHLELSDTLSFSGTDAAFPAGSVLKQTDRFDTSNVFNGGEVGLTASLQRCRWTIDTVMKIAVGQTNSEVTIDGVTRTSIPGQAITFDPGGILALPSNMGRFGSQRFSVVPELELKLGWNFTPQLRGTIGYDLFYWTGVARPGDQIDLTIDPGQFPPPTTASSTRPQFVLHTSDYWAQGLNLGFDLRF